MTELSWNALRRLVHERAQGCCEYCQTSEANNGQTMQVDHIDPDGEDVSENLCLSCWNRNNHKHTAKTAVDPMDGEIVSLYNPRTERWADHFEWVDSATRIQGLTAIGRATIIRLKLNRIVIVNARQRWGAGGYHPPLITNT